jgi:hypothetical protein
VVTVVKFMLDAPAFLEWLMELSLWQLLGCL